METPPRRPDNLIEVNFTSRRKGTAETQAPPVTSDQEEAYAAVLGSVGLTPEILAARVAARRHEMEAELAAKQSGPTDAPMAEVIQLRPNTEDWPPQPVA